MATVTLKSTQAKLDTMSKKKEDLSNQAKEAEAALDAARAKIAQSEGNTEQGLIRLQSMWLHNAISRSAYFPAASQI